MRLVLGPVDNPSSTETTRRVERLRPAGLLRPHLAEDALAVPDVGEPQLVPNDTTPFSAAISLGIARSSSSQAACFSLSSCFLVILLRLHLRLDLVFVAVPRDLVAAIPTVGSNAAVVDKHRQAPRTLLLAEVAAPRARRLVLARTAVLEPDALFVEQLVDVDHRSRS